MASPAQHPPPPPPRPSHRKQHLNSLLFSTNAANPFESVVEAAPATRHMAQHRLHHQPPLELLAPTGLDAELSRAMQQQLTHFIAASSSSTRAAVAPRVDVSPPRSPLLKQRATAAAAAGTAHGAGGGGATLLPGVLQLGPSGASVNGAARPYGSPGLSRSTSLTLPTAGAASVATTAAPWDAASAVASPVAAATRGARSPSPLRGGGHVAAVPPLQSTQSVEAPPHAGANPRAMSQALAAGPAGLPAAAAAGYTAATTQVGLFLLVWHLSY